MLNQFVVNPFNVVTARKVDARYCVTHDYVATDSSPGGMDESECWTKYSSDADGECRFVDCYALDVPPCTP